MSSLIIIAPAAYATAVNLLVQSVNPSWGDDNLTVPLSASGEVPATHKGCCLANPSPSFLAMIDAVEAGTYAPPAPYTLQDVQSLLGLLIIDRRPGIDNPRAHFDDVLAANGLQEVQTSGNLITRIDLY